MFQGRCYPFFVFSGGFLAPCNFSFFSWALPFLVINSYLSKKKKDLNLSMRLYDLPDLNLNMRLYDLPDLH